jgi:hypothetical protein
MEPFKSIFDNETTTQIKQIVFVQMKNILSAITPQLARDIVSLRLSF